MAAFLDKAARILLTPIVVLQALWVMKRALRLPEAAGPREGTLGEGTLLRILIVGDSSSVGVGVPTQDDALAGHVTRAFAQHRHVQWRVVGQNGITTGGLVKLLQTQPAGKFDLAVIALGVNDTKNGVPLRQWQRDYAALLDLLRGRFGVRHVAASGLPSIRNFTLFPQPLRWVFGRRTEVFDAALQEIAARAPDITHVPIDQPLRQDLMADDGFHPGPVIYKAWAKRILDATLETLN